MKPLPRLFGSLALLLAAWPAVAEPSVDFNRDVRPLLSDACFQCHGPDQAKRKAKLRLDTEAGARSVVAAGAPERSELYRRVTATDPAQRMPPAKHGRALTTAQVARLRAWIEQGARWQSHWAFVPPQRPEAPPVRRTDWVRNPIDRFVLARLEREGLTPSPEAERTTLLRRATLDLTGLPPTPEAVMAFLTDRAPDAYERAVDRLLASPRYGERMAVRWLDAARYADTNGYQSDGERIMWRWRDGVIEAFNANRPFDQFTLEQLAGDLLPGATLDQVVASGFNRNHRGNGEGGVISEEYAVEYVVDRVETTAAVWLGLTMGCGRCHDHKYDPISQKEFYQVFGFFNNVPERGKAVKFGNSPPVVVSPTDRQRAQLADLERRLQTTEAEFVGRERDAAGERAAWEQSLAGLSLDWAPARGLVAHFPFDQHPADATGRGVTRFAAGTPAYAPGMLGAAAAFDGRSHVEAGDIGDFGFYDKFTLAAWVRPQGAVGGTLISRMTDVPQGDGYALALVDGRVQVNLVKRWLDDALRVETETRLEPGRWHHVAATYDGSRVAAAVRVYVDGRPAPLRVLLDDLNQSFATKEPLRVGAGGGPGSRLHGLLDDVRVYGRALAAEEVAVLAQSQTVADLAALPPGTRSPAQALKLRDTFLEEYSPPALRDVYQRVVALRAERQTLVESFPTTMVMQERPTLRDTFVLRRGQYDQPGEKVEPDVPAALGALPSAGRRDRLAFARWLVDPAQPLTARVAVNRAWQLHFGTGLVKTAEDFGSQGELPSHPELLDWLATELVRSGWDVKGLHRLIVTSATYRQASRWSPELRQRDPENRLLARGPRLRLSAEMVRDGALAASGLLVERLGGPSVRPYQPAGLWKELTGTEEYQQDHGAALYRRGLYTFWKRTVAPPGLVAFDAAGREACMVRETRTNTPLQALNLLNDVTYVEAARALAERVLREAGPSVEARVTRMFLLVLGRTPRPAESAVLVAGLEAHRAEFRRDREAAARLLAVGESRSDGRFEAAELAAYAATAGLILNLDEAIVKE